MSARLDFHPSFVSVVSSPRKFGEERGLISRTAAGNRAYMSACWGAMMYEIVRHDFWKAGVTEGRKIWLVSDSNASNPSYDKQAILRPNQVKRSPKVYMH